MAYTFYKIMTVGLAEHGPDFFSNKLN